MPAREGGASGPGAGRVGAWRARCMPAGGGAPGGGGEACWRAAPSRLVGMSHKSTTFRFTFSGPEGGRSRGRCSVQRACWPCLPSPPSLSAQLGLWAGRVICAKAGWHSADRVFVPAAGLRRHRRPVGSSPCLGAGHLVSGVPRSFSAQFVARPAASACRRRVRRREAHRGVRQRSPGDDPRETSMFDRASCASHEAVLGLLVGQIGGEGGGGGQRREVRQFLGGGSMGEWGWGLRGVWWGCGGGCAGAGGGRGAPAPLPPVGGGGLGWLGAIGGGAGGAGGGGGWGGGVGWWLGGPAGPGGGGGRCAGRVVRGGWGGG